ncbi:MULTISPECIES: tyrosine-type recombinase/integrase [Burkholderia cepacia complex]|uniref:Integrase n=1 Tax=Burkholderia contaminans TaxID=488447 RepID=A0A2S5DM85_9BURK|nr:MULTISPECIES: tyrosine-type recombinase/integrase [Burkholderia cepacia complex]MBR7919698.1 tyrosine-type recombinase/integrase [Burkholderia vietnamiensis]MBR8205347.1 tyrosine-type recombinase/integrase [Burkholderia vietnamiensis]POZ80209.1 integrase [Burkholderia contaminans]HDR9131995.1 tyrosine-type recombinase/integrase [Burkholderia vietnamiensis]
MFANEPPETLETGFGAWLGSGFDHPYSVRTQRVYRSVVRAFLVFAEEHAIGDPGQVNAPWIRLFVVGSRNASGDRYSQTYRNVRVAALSAFWEWLILTGRSDQSAIVNYMRMCSTDNSRKIGRPAGGKPPRRLPPVLMWDHQKALLAAAEASDSRTSVRDHAIMALILATGLRSDEVCSLEANMVTLAYRRLRVIGKGNKERLVDFSHAPEAIGVLELWLEERADFLGDAGVESPYFFVTRTGKRLTGSLVYQQVSRYIRVAGLGAVLSRKGGAHVLRHTATSIMFARNVPVLQIQENLGHEDLKTTQIYAHLLPREHEAKASCDFG